MSQSKLTNVQPKLNCSLDIRPHLQVVGCLIYLDIARDVSYSPFKVCPMHRRFVRQATILRLLKIRRHSESNIC